MDWLELLEKLNIFPVHAIVCVGVIFTSLIISLNNKSSNNSRSNVNSAITVGSKKIRKKILTYFLLHIMVQIVHSKYLWNSQLQCWNISTRIYQWINFTIWATQMFSSFSFAISHTKRDLILSSTIKYIMCYS